MVTLMPSVLLGTFLSVLFLLNSCSIRTTQPGPPAPAEMEAVKRQKKSIVLMKLNSTLNGEPMDSAADFFEFGLANVQLAEPMKPVAPFPLLSEGKEKGWIYFVLQPGTYNFWVIPPRSALKNYRYQFDVPTDNSLIYAGSINITCWSGGIFGHLTGCSHEPTLGRAVEAAKAVAQDSFSAYGDPSVLMMRPYGALTSFDSPQPLFPAAISTTFRGDLTSPDWRNRPVTWDPAPFIPVPSRQVNLGEFTVVWLIAAFTLNPGYNATVHAQETESLKEKWEPCQKELAEDLLEFDPVGKLRLRMRDELRRYGVAEIIELKGENAPSTLAQKKGFSTFLHTDIQLVGLRECQGGGTFCIHVVGRTRVLEAGTKKPLYERSLLYSSSPLEYESSPFRWAELPFHAYDLPVEKPSTCRRIDAYCSEGGHKILREELSKAIEFMAESVLQDLRLQPETTQTVK